MQELRARLPGPREEFPSHPSEQGNELCASASAGRGFEASVPPGKGRLPSSKPSCDAGFSHLKSRDHKSDNIRA